MTRLRKRRDDDILRHVVYPGIMAFFSTGTTPRKRKAGGAFFWGGEGAKVPEE